MNPANNVALAPKLEETVNWTNDLAESALSDLQLVPMLLNLLLTILMGTVMAWHYRRYARVLSNREKFARLLVFIGVTTMLVISVVKTSLALSLGLVGALSIIRFRTPVKEPEDLAYLFLAIVTGIGIGADQRVTTVVVVLLLLVFLALRDRRRGGAVQPWLLAQIDASIPDGSDVETVLKSVVGCAEKFTPRVDLRRVDSQDQRFHASMLIDLEDSTDLGRFIGTLEQTLPGASVTVIEAGSLD